MARVIRTEELQKKIEDGEGDFYLIDALSEKSFEGRHIPGALNVPNGTDFLENFESKVRAEKDDRIIVYCSSSSCNASVQAAEVLEEAGYSNVVHYKDGLAGWKEAGHAFESGKE